MSESQTPPGVRRRSSGPRHEASERVRMVTPSGAEVDGWTLNESDSGLRVVVDEAALAESGVYRVTVGDGPPRNARVVWVKDETGGQIAGVEFLDEP